MHSEVSCGELSIENPISEDENYRLEVLVAAERLDRLDKDKFDDDDKEEAERIRMECREEMLLVSGRCVVLKLYMIHTWHNLTVNKL